MKPQIYADKGRLFSLILLILFIPVYISAQDFRSVQDGIEYAEMTRQIDNQPVKMNLLRLDLTKVRLDVVHAMDAAIGLETTSSIAARHGAIAAINAGFFRLDRSIFAGDAAGILQIDGKLFSESYANRTAFAIYNGKAKTDVDIAQLDLTAFVKIGKKIFKISGINRQRGNDDLIEYTSVFGNTTLTEPSGTEIIIRNGKIAKIMTGKGSSPIPADGSVLSVNGKMQTEVLRFSKVGMKAQVHYERKITIQRVSHSPYNQNFDVFDKAEDIVGGVPQLINNGRIEITWEQEKSSKGFVETRHPRTAVAKLKDGKFLMVTVDGRQAESAGINLENLAEILLELGATEAMNFDGGGSTTMFLNGKVVNRPSDKEGERKVSDAILVFSRKK